MLQPGSFENLKDNMMHQIHLVICLLSIKYPPPKNILVLNIVLVI